MSLRTKTALAALAAAAPAAAAVFLPRPAACLAAAACVLGGAFAFYWAVDRPLERLTALLWRARKPLGIPDSIKRGRDELGIIVRSLGHVARSHRGYKKAVFSALKSVQRANSRLRVSQYLAQKALAMEDEREFWRLLAEHLTLFFSCDRVTVYQRESEDHLLSRFAQGSGAPLRVRLGEGIAGHAAKTQTPFVCNAPYKDAHFNASFDKSTGYRTQNLLAFPLLYQGKTLGAVELLNKPGGFQDYDVEVMQDLGPQIAVFMVKFNAEERQKELTRQMMQVEKMAAVGRLAAGVAHEINNPLSSIMGFTQLLLRQIKDSPSAREDLVKIDSESKRIRTIVQNLLGFSRASPPAFSSVRLADVITGSLALVQHELKHKPIEIVSDFDDRTPMIPGDANSLKQVFINLVLNAAQALGDKAGRIVFKVRPSADLRGVEVEVCDDGPGIPPENLGKIFEPFFTTKPVGKGTGLGLYVVLGIVEHHRGKISVESELGRGTTFKLFFPVSGA